MLLAAWMVASAGRYAMDDNHPSWRWRTLETERSRIHFPVGRGVHAEPTAQRVAVEVDPLLERLEEEIGRELRGPLHIVVLEDTDAMEGFTLPHQSWVVFSASPGDALSRMRGRADWVPDLLAHELAHVLVERELAWLPSPVAGLGVELGGLIEEAGSQTGGLVSFSDAEPYWFSEGSAEYWSERVGVNRWTSARAMTVRAAVLDGRLGDLEDRSVSSRLDHWNEGERAYQLGYAFLRWFVDAYGVERLRAVNAAAGAQTRWRWEAVFEEVTGEPFERLEERFRRALEADVRAVVERVEAAGVVEGRELSTWSLAWDDGSLRARDRWGLVSLEERIERREATGTLSWDQSWSTDGRWVARQRSGWVEVRQADESMYTVFAGGTPDWDATRVQRQRSRDTSAWLPSVVGGGVALAPKGDHLLMVGPARVRGWQRPRLDHHHLYEVELSVEDGRLRRPRMRPVPGGERAADPAIGPNGERAWVRWKGGASDLVVEVDGRPVVLAEGVEGVGFASPSFSPDGQRIVVARHVGDREGLWVFDLASGGGRPLLATAIETVDPWWAPDGSILFAADLEGVYDIFRWLPDGHVVRQTRVRTGARSPAETPSGELVYAQYTSFGWKMVGLRRSELAWQSVTDRFTAREAPVRSVLPPMDTRGYSALRSLQPLAMSPTLRLDHGPEGWMPRIGGFLRLRDAVENHTITASGWAGRDSSVHGRWVWHGLWPDLSIEGRHVRTRMDGELRTLSSWRARARLPLRDDVMLDVEAGGFRVGREHHSRTLGLGLGRRRSLARPAARGTSWWLLGSAGWSNGARPYTRLEGGFDRVTRAPFGDAHRLGVRLAAAWTDKEVGAEDQLWLGGNHPAAVRPGRYQATVRLPGYAPYAFGTRRFGLAGARWRVPLARRVGSRSGPLRFDEVWGWGGGDVAVVDGTGLLGDLEVGVRLDGSVAGRPFGVRSWFAWGAGEAGGPRPGMSFGTPF